MKGERARAFNPETWPKSWKRHLHCCQRWTGRQHHSPSRERPTQITFRPIATLVHTDIQLSAAVTARPENI